MYVDKKKNDAIISLTKREEGEHKEKRHSAYTAGKVEKELGADDCYHSAPGEERKKKQPLWEA